MLGHNRTLTNGASLDWNMKTQVLWLSGQGAFLFALQHRFPVKVVQDGTAASLNSPAKVINSAAFGAWRATRANRRPPPSILTRLFVAETSHPDYCALGCINALALAKSNIGKS
jgi:hypothetical protein